VFRELLYVMGHGRGAFLTSPSAGMESDLY
jgi:hypothetical protein